MRRLLAVALVMVLGWSCLVALVPLIAQEEDPISAMRGDTGKGGESEPQTDGGWPKSYTIVPGDWLIKISQRFYGTPYLWTLIYNANRDKIGDNPNLIYPNVTLTIPKPDGTIPTASGTQAGTVQPNGLQGGAGSFNQNLPCAHGTVTSNFGWRTLRGASDYHSGLDVGISTGTPIRSTGPGRVVWAGSKGGYGNLVEVAHPDGTITYYAHLRNSTVRVGDTVAPGQLIAYSNNTGNSTGPHLHFAVQANGSFKDPRNYFSFPGEGRSF